MLEMLMMFKSAPAWVGFLIVGAFVIFILWLVFWKLKDKGGQK